MSSSFSKCLVIVIMKMKDPMRSSMYCLIWLKSFQAMVMLEIFDFDAMDDMFFILSGSSMDEWLETANQVTRLYPFMSMAMPNKCNFETLYEFAMKSMHESKSLTQFTNRQAHRHRLVN